MIILIANDSVLPSKATGIIGPCELIWGGLNEQTAVKLSLPAASNCPELTSWREQNFQNYFWFFGGIMSPHQLARPSEGPAHAGCRCGPVTGLSQSELSSTSSLQTEQGHRQKTRPPLWGLPAARPPGSALLLLQAVWPSGV